MRLDQTLGHASAHQVVVRVQMRGPDGVEVRECPAAEFEPSDRGVTMGAIFVPWQRIYRYDTIVEQGFIPEGHETETRTLQRVVFEDEGGVARSVEVPLDRYETGPWHLTIVIERKVDRQRGSLSIRKVCIPWGRVIETERVFTVPDAQEVPEPPDPTVKEWFDGTELEDGADDEPADVVAALDATDDVVVVATTERGDAERDAALAKLFEIPEAEPTPEPERTG